MPDPQQEPLFPEFPASPDRLRGPWIPVYIDLFNHGKLHELAEHLQPDIHPSDALNYALGTVVRWWGWVFKYAPDGEIDIGRGSTVRAMAAACGWADDPQKLLESLVKSGFAESHKRRTKGHENFFLVAHDWGEHAGSYLKARRDAAKRQAEKRARDKQSRNFVLGNSHGDVTRDVGVTSGTTGTQPEPESNRTGVLPPGTIDSSDVESLVREARPSKRAVSRGAKPAAVEPSASLSGGLSADVIFQLTTEYSDRLAAGEVTAELAAWEGHASWDRWTDKLAGGRRWLNHAIKHKAEGETNGTGRRKNSTHGGSEAIGADGGGPRYGADGRPERDYYAENAEEFAERERLFSAGLAGAPPPPGRATSAGTT